MKAVFYILFATLFTFAVSLAAGKLLIQRCRATLYRSEELFLGFISGAACLSFLVFMLTAAGLARKGVFFAVGAVVIAGAWRTGAWSFTTERLPPLPRLWRWLLAGPFVVFTLLYLSNALAPDVGSDSVNYHLAFVARYYREHHFPAITTNMYASLWEGLEMLFLFTYGFAKSSASGMTHFLFLLALPFGMISYGRRRGEPVAGALGAMLVYLCPTVGMDGISGYVDVGLCTVLFAVFYIAQIWRETRQPGLLILLGICSGFAFSIKITAFIAILYALGVVIATLRKERAVLIQSLAIVSVCAFLMIAPWLAKNALIVSNPFSPFANRLFPNPYIYQSFEVELGRGMANFNGLNSIGEIFTAVTIRGGKPQGLLGPVFLLAPLVLLSLRWKMGRELVPAALVCFLPYPANLGTRFLLPCLPFVALALSIVLSRWSGVAPLILFAHAVLSWPPVAKLYGDEYLWIIQRFEWNGALRLEQEPIFLRRHLNDYNLGLQVEKTVPAGQPVLVAGSLQQAYQSRELIGAWQSAFGTRMQDMLWTPLALERQPTWRHEFQFPAKSVQRIRVIQTEASEVDEWSISEMRVYNGQQELPRAPQWRLKASDNPWEVQRAFDNSLVTRWRSGRHHQPGMYVQIDFGKPQMIDRVLLDSPHNQRRIYLRMVYEENGVWRRLGGEPIRSDVPCPTRLRRMAIQEMEASGIHWFLCDNTEFGANDYLEHSLQWGMKPVLTDGRLKLYHFE